MGPRIREDKRGWVVHGGMVVVKGDLWQGDVGSGADWEMGSRPPPSRDLCITTRNASRMSV